MRYPDQNADRLGFPHWADWYNVQANAEYWRNDPSRIFDADRANTTLRHADGCVAGLSRSLRSRHFPAESAR